MNWKEFLEESARTDHPMFHKDMLPEFYHAIIGMVTESAELMDIAKKNLFYAKPVDVAHVREELGDVMWYVAQLCRNMHFDLDEIMQENIDKLKMRYPEQFTTQDALERKDKLEPMCEWTCPVCFTGHYVEANERRINCKCGEFYDRRFLP